MSIQFGKINNNIFVNSTATYENGIISISSPENAEKINFYAPSNANDSDLYEINGKQVILSNILNNNPEITWVKGAPISAVYDSQNNKLFINSINGENSLFSNLFRNSSAEVIENKVIITSIKDAVDLFNFYSPKAYSANDIYEVNGQVYDVVDLQGNKLESGWNSDVPVSLVLNENKLWYSANSSDTKLPSDLSPLCPNFKVERNGGKIKITADKIQLNSYTNMVSGGVWAWGKTRPVKPTGENTKQWSRAELITTGKPYDGLYLGDVTPSDAVTETLIYLPENIGGKVVLSAFIILSTDYLGGVYITRLYTESEWLGAFGTNSTYAGSTADNWFEKTYLGSILHESVSSQLLTCDVPVMGQGTVSRRCWPLSSRELDSASSEVGGEFMPYFSTAQRRISYLDGGTTGGVYWMRTKSDATKVFTVTAQGGFGTQNASYTPVAYRPCFVLPKDFKIQQRPDGSYTVWNEQGLMTLGDIEASDNGVETIVNIPTTSGLNAVRYTMKTYNEQDVGLMEYRNSVGSSNYSPNDRSKLLFEASNLYSTLVSTMDSAFSDSLKTLIPSVNVKLTRNSGSVEDVSLKYFILSLTEIGAELGNGKVEGTLVPWYADPTKKAARGNGFTRTINMGGSYYTAYCTNTSGDTFANPPDYTHVIWPVFCLPLTAPIRALADGSYDLVPEDPALSAQSISTLAEEEEVPLEIELDWPESDPLIARQWVYNEKGVYQTMLLGGIASTEDAPAYSPVLSENTWEQIAQACADRDPILDSWLVGDEKDEVINGETLTFVIVGKDHDDKADGSGKAPLTFGMKNLMAETRKMNSSNTSSGSFAGSAMYSWLSGTIYPNLPTELKDAIKAVNKKTSSGGGSSSIRTDAMYLWLFAEIEVFGSTTYSYAGEGTQYPYFATLAERIKRLSNGAGAASYWWERSPRRNTSTRFCSVDTSGLAYDNAAENSYGVCFGFCI